MTLMASGQSQAIEGMVRIAAFELFAAHLLPPIVARLRSIAPKIEVDIVTAKTVSDLLQREGDIAVRNVRPEQPDLITCLIRDSSGRFYASKGYIQKRRRPRNYQDFKTHDFVSFGNTDQMLEYLAVLGLELTAAQFKVGSSNSLVAWEMVKQGFGIASMSVDVARASPDLEVLLPYSDPVIFPTWLVTYRELHTSRPIRLVFDLLAVELLKLMA